MKVLITGGCGFIGSHLAHELCGEYEVIVVDNLSTGSRDNIRELDVELLEGDITDLPFLQSALEGVDYVLHQAAVVSVPESVADPLRTNEVNVGGTLNVLVAARDNGVKKVVNASSCAVYGETEVLPVGEDVLPRPGSPYAAAKLASEYYCQVFTMYGLNTVSLRYFNVYGPRQSPGSDYAAVIPKFASRAINEEELTIYGDGEQTRDFVYVKDVVRANLLAMKSEESGVFNVATGKEVSVNQLATLILKGGDKVVYEPPREGDIKHSVGDVRRIRDRLGFEPRYGIEEGLREVMEWFKGS